MLVHVITLELDAVVYAKAHLPETETLSKLHYSEYQYLEIWPRTTVMIKLKLIMTICIDRHFLPTIDIIKIPSLRMLNSRNPGAPQIVNTYDYMLFSILKSTCLSLLINIHYLQDIAQYPLFDMLECYKF